MLRPSQRPDPFHEMEDMMRNRPIPAQFLAAEAIAFDSFGSRTTL